MTPIFASTIGLRGLAEAVSAGFSAADAAGLTEAGAFCSWLAAATSYNTNQLAMLPFYIYYSMFGFQRIGDLAWAAGDQRARGAGHIEVRRIVSVRDEAE